MANLLHTDRKGFIAFYSFILLLILGIFGIAYWWTSRLTTDMIVKESHRIIARNLAQAGVEKALVHIMNQYRLGNPSFEYPTGGNLGFSRDKADKEFNVSFADGSYLVEHIKPYVVPGSDRKMSGIPYFKNRVHVGFYDVWDISVIGKVDSTGIKVKVQTLAKVIRNFVQY